MMAHTCERSLTREKRCCKLFKCVSRKSFNWRGSLLAKRKGNKKRAKGEDRSLTTAIIGMVLIHSKNGPSMGSPLPPLHLYLLRCDQKGRSVSREGRG